MIARRLARVRVPLGFVFGAAVFLLSHPTATTLASGVPLAVIGELLRVWAAGHLNKSREVTASGPYRFFGHPLYVGSSLMGLGLAIASGNPFVVVLIAAYLGATLTAAIRSEEAFLRQTFGDRYDQYRRGHAAGADRSRRFSFAQAKTNREYRAVAGLAVAVLLLVLKATYNGAFWGQQLARSEGG